MNIYEIFPDFDDFNKSDQEDLLNISKTGNILNFEEIQKGVFGKGEDPFAGIRTSKTFEEMSPFKDSPFGQYWDKRIPKYAENLYGPGLALGSDAFRVFDLSKRMSQTKVRFYESLKSESWDDIQFKVYANPDGKQVLKEYANQDYSPKENEVLFFIETDDGKFDFGKIVRVKLGKNAIEKLRFRFPFLGETSEEELAEIFLKRTFEIKNNSNYDFVKASKEVSLDTGELKKLLVKAIKYDYDQKEFDDMSWYLVFLQYEEYIALNTPKKLLELSQWMRTKKYKEEKYWNALLEKGFTPAFLPDVIVPNNRKDFKESIKKKFQENIDEITKYDRETGVFEKIYKEILSSTLNYLFDQFSTLLDEGLKKLDEILPEGEILHEIYNLNAFLVGLWNGCIELVAGIIDLVALVMMIAKDGIGYTLTDSIGESLENLMNDIVYGFEAFIKKLWIKFVHVLEKFPDWFLKYGTNSYFWYKELGELTPDIISILVPALKAGKASKLKSAGAVATAREVSEEVSEEVMEKSVKELSEKLEKETAQKEVKESFEAAETELEEKIPEKKKKVYELPFELKLKEMDRMFLSEETGKGWCKPKAVKYLNEYERLEYRLSIKDGKVYDELGNLFDTSDAGNLFGDGKAIFVMDKYGEIFASKHQKFGEFHHSSFLSGNPVASAGELKVTKGIIEEVTRKSGHYRPSEEINKQLIKVLEAKEIDTKNINLSDGF